MLRRKSQEKVRNGQAKDKENQGADEEKQQAQEIKVESTVGYQGEQDTLQDQAKVETLKEILSADINQNGLSEGADGQKAP